MAVLKASVNLEFDSGRDCRWREMRGVTWVLFDLLKTRRGKTEATEVLYL